MLVLLLEGEERVVGVFGGDGWYWNTIILHLSKDHFNPKHLLNTLDISLFVVSSFNSCVFASERVCVCVMLSFFLLPRVTLRALKRLFFRFPRTININKLKKINTKRKNKANVFNIIFYLIHSFN